MSFLDRVGLGPKPGRRPGRPGIRFEGRGPAGPPPLTRAALLRRAGLLAGLVVLAVLAFPRAEFYETAVQVGDVWRGGDVVAPFNFPLSVPAEELDAARDSIRRSEPPVFLEDAGALDASLARIDTLRARLGAALQAEATPTDTASADAVGAPNGGSAADTARALTLSGGVPLTLPGRQWQALVSSYAGRGGSGGPPLHERLLRTTAGEVRELLARGVLDLPAARVAAPYVAVRRSDPRARDERRVRRTDVLALDEALAAAEANLREEYGPDAVGADAVGAGLALVRAALQPSLRFDRVATQRGLEEQLRELPSTRGLVREGFTIVRRGDEVTPEVHAALNSLETAQRDRSGEIAAYRAYLGEALLAMAAYTIFFLYLYLLRRTVFDDFRAFSLITLLFGVVVLAFAFAARSSWPDELAIPVALVSILLTVLFDSRVGMFGTMTLAILGGLIFGYDFEFTFATLFGGLVAVFSVRDVKNRSQLLLSAALVLLAYLTIGAGYALLRADTFGGRLVGEGLGVTVNALLLLLAAPLLYGIERAFGFTTDLTLLELSDTNRKLLKNLSLRAPGTFNHVLQVANLAEAAADAVGANALRARVGGLYHDIGKMLKPEYFVENQQPGENPHDRITPYMSALIVAAHVRDGVEIGRAEQLPQPILDFIPSHHGTGLMEYFYRRAVEANPPGGPPVDEAEFRYPGPRPQTAEQAIVMLADSVEAASRSLQKPTPRRLEGLIDAIFRARLDDGQLSQAPLTFADLSRIKETFLSILSGIYHFRVKYPGQDAEDAEEEPAAGETAPLVQPRAGLDVALPSEVALPAEPARPAEAAVPAELAVRPDDTRGGDGAATPAESG